MVDLENIVKDKSKDTNEEKIKYTLNKIKSSPSMIELDNTGQRIIYKDTNYLLQKWNNIILNYNGGTLDVFYNGELVKSVNGIVPYMSLDALTIGSTNGIQGGICNLLYYKQPLTSTNIYYSYHTVKDKKVPIF